MTSSHIATLSILARLGLPIILREVCHRAVCAVLVNVHGPSRTQEIHGPPPGLE